jgi:hypothetical protein
MGCKHVNSNHHKWKNASQAYATLHEFHFAGVTHNHMCAKRQITEVLLCVPQTKKRPHLLDQLDSSPGEVPYEAFSEIAHVRMR